MNLYEGLAALVVLYTVGCGSNPVVRETSQYTMGIPPSIAVVEKKQLTPKEVERAVECEVLPKVNAFVKYCVAESDDLISAYRTYFTSYLRRATDLSQSNHDPVEREFFKKEAVLCRDGLQRLEQYARDSATHEKVLYLYRDLLRDYDLAPGEHKVEKIKID